MQVLRPHPLPSPLAFNSVYERIQRLSAHSQINHRRDPMVDFDNLILYSIMAKSCALSGDLALEIERPIVRITQQIVDAVGR